jgi:hypothetical protein
MSCSVEELFFEVLFKTTEYTEHTEKVGFLKFFPCVPWFLSLLDQKMKVLKIELFYRARMPPFLRPILATSY